MHFAPRTSQLVHSPIGAAHALVAQRTNQRPLLDLSQAAPSFPPAPEVAGRISEVAHEPDGGRYAPQPGIPALRDAFAADMTLAYGSALEAGNVLITAGCNQAFCVVVGAIAEPGDSVVLASPFYFNHDMWLKVQGIEVRYLQAQLDGVPDPAALAALTDERTRAVVLVTPGNPTGVTIDPEIIAAFGAESRRLGITLVLDETYRTYRPTKDAPHDQFVDPTWGDHLVSLHSFSKDFAIPGYRVGAVVGGHALVTEALKVLDCVAISAPRIGQEAALAGLLQAGEWRHEQVRRIARLQNRFEAMMSNTPGGFELASAGAYFGWIRHPFGSMSTAEVVRRLVLDHDVLVIPGTAFTPTDERMLRFSFANLTPTQIDELPERLQEMHDSV